MTHAEFIHTMKVQSLQKSDLFRRKLYRLLFLVSSRLNCIKLLNEHLSKRKHLTVNSDWLQLCIHSQHIGSLIKKLPK